MQEIMFYVTFAVILMFTALLIYYLFFDPSPSGKGSLPHPGVSISAAGSVVTVRKVGDTTMVDIRSDIHDHWEDDGRGVQVAESPIELTRSEQPQLYEEYMSASTAASRKYEIAEYLYEMGYTVPFIRGLNEQYRLELQQNGNTPATLSVNPATEATRPSAPEEDSEQRGGIVFRKLTIDRDLSNEISDN